MANIHTMVSSHASLIQELGNKLSGVVNRQEQILSELETLRGSISQRLAAVEQELLRAKADISMLNELNGDFEYTPTASAAPVTSRPSVEVPRARVPESNSRLPLIFSKDGQTWCPIGGGRREQCEASGYEICGTHSADGATFFVLKLRK